MLPFDSSLPPCCGVLAPAVLSGVAGGLGEGSGWGRNGFCWLLPVDSNRCLSKVCWARNGAEQTKITHHIHIHTLPLKYSRIFHFKGGHLRENPDHLHLASDLFTEGRRGGHFELALKSYLVHWWENPGSCYHLNQGGLWRLCQERVDVCGRGFPLVLLTNIRTDFS